MTVGGSSGSALHHKCNITEIINNKNSPRPTLKREINKNEVVLNCTRLIHVSPYTGPTREILTRLFLEGRGYLNVSHCKVILATKKKSQAVRWYTSFQQVCTTVLYHSNINVGFSITKVLTYFQNKDCGTLTCDICLSIFRTLTVCTSRNWRKWPNCRTAALLQYHARGKSWKNSLCHWESKNWSVYVG